MAHAEPTAPYELPTCVPDFLSREECRGLMDVIDAASLQQAEVWIGDDFGVHPESRRGAIGMLSTESEIFVQDRVWSVVADLERRFDCEISHLSGVTALIYGPGDHFAAHSDGGLQDDGPSEVRRRRVSLVVALNDGARDFSGGELHLFPHAIPNSLDGREQVIAIRSEPGLLIAFASPMVHQVVPVREGCRYSLALWALAPESPA